MILKIYRIEKTNEFTAGILLIDGCFICCTLEEPWLNNEKSKSCIPKGKYTCSKVTSPKFGETIQVDGVQNRSHILFHSGNTTNDTEGCILLGRRFGTMDTKKAILNSKLAVSDFLKIVKDKELELEIIEL